MKNISNPTDTTMDPSAMMGVKNAFQRSRRRSLLISSRSWFVGGISISAMSLTFYITPVLSSTGVPGVKNIACQGAGI